MTYHVDEDDETFPDHEDHEDLDDLCAEQVAVMEKLKSIKRIYNTDHFDNIIDDGFIAYEDLAEILIHSRILTSDDRDELFEAIYKCHDKELEGVLYDSDN